MYIMYVVCTMYIYTDNVHHLYYVYYVYDAHDVYGVYVYVYVVCNM